MGKIINLEHFRLEQISITSDKHNEIIKAFDRDALVKKYLFPYKESFFDLINESFDGDTIFNTFYIIYTLDKPIGYVEIETSNNTYLNYALLSGERKKGYATLFLKELSMYLLDNYKEVNSVNAIIRKSNIASIKAASNSGMKKVDEDSKFETYRKSR